MEMLVTETAKAMGMQAAETVTVDRMAQARAVMVAAVALQEPAMV